MVTGRIGHGGTATAQDAEVLSIARFNAVELWVFSQLDLQTVGSRNCLQVFAAVSACYCGIGVLGQTINGGARTHDGQGLAQVTMNGAAIVANKVQTQAGQAATGIFNQVLHLTQVGRVGGAGACGNVAQGVATEAHVTFFDGDVGVACGVAQYDAIGAISRLVTGRIGHGGTATAQDAEVLSIARFNTVELWVFSQLDLQTVSGHQCLQVFAAVSACYCGIGVLGQTWCLAARTHDGQGLAQVAVGIACVAGEVQTQADQAVSGAFNQVLHLTQVGRVGGAGACGNVAQGVATEAHVTFFDGDVGVTCGVTQYDAIGAVSGLFVTRSIGHGGTATAQYAEVACGVASNHAVELWVFSQLDLQTVSGHQCLQVFAAVSACYCGIGVLGQTWCLAARTHDGQGLAQVAVGIACVAGEVQTQADQAVSGAFNQVLHLTQVGRVGGAGTCGNIAQGVATEAHVTFFDVDVGVACGVTQYDAVGAVSGLFVTRSIGHGGTATAQDAEVLSIARFNTVELWVFSQLDLQVAIGIHNGFHVFAAVSTSITCFT